MWFKVTFHEELYCQHSFETGFRLRRNLARSSIESTQVLTVALNAFQSVWQHTKRHAYAHRLLDIYAVKSELASCQGTARADAVIDRIE